MNDSKLGGFGAKAKATMQDIDRHQSGIQDTENGQRSAVQQYGNEDIEGAEGVLRTAALGPSWAL